jgi:hypothetical protein
MTEMASVPGDHCRAIVDDRMIGCDKADADGGLATFRLDEIKLSGQI